MSDARAARMKLQVVLQIADAARDANAPSATQVRDWARAALRVGGRGGALTVRVVDEDEMIDLNQRYRGAHGATDVLAFPFDADGVSRDMNIDIIGDIVICAPVVTAQAHARGIALTRHWAHIVIHGALHLCGFDHQRDDEAARMERIERALLDSFEL